MAIKEKMDSLHAELTQRQKAIELRVQMQNAQMAIQESNRNIQEIADSGSFETLDSELKQVLIACWNVIKNAQIAFDAANIKELLDWRP